MKIDKILLDKGFISEFKKLPSHIQHISLKHVDLFKLNPFHPSLRMHKLGGKLDGLWSISVNMKYRIIFKPQENGDILLVSIGTHSIYDS